MKQSIKRVGIWIRVSTAMQADGDSPEHHLHRAAAYAQQQGWEVVEVYRLDGVSGRAVHDHPEMLRMIADVESGKIQGLIFSSLTRLARTKSTLWNLAELFQEHKAALICLDMAIDTSSPAGELVFSVFSAFAEWEAQLIADRVRKSTVTRAKMGKSLGGEAVYGYRWNDNKLEPDPVEAPIRSLIYELYIEHQTFSQVAKELNQRGYKSRRGKQWSAAAIMNLIFDPTAKGQKVSNTVRPKSQRKKHGRNKPQEDWIYTEVTPIIDPDVWERCQQIALKRRAQRRKRTKYPFAGLVYCECGEKMYHDGTSIKSPKYRCKQCKTSFPASVLNDVFRSIAWEFFDPESGEHQSRIEQQIETRKSLLQSHKCELSKARGSLQRIESDYLESRLDADRYQALCSKLEKKIESLNAEAAKITGQIDALKTEILTAKQTSKEMQSEIIRWEDLNEKEKIKLVRVLVERIDFSGGELSVQMSYMGSIQHS